MTADHREEAILDAMKKGDKEVYMKLLIELNKEDKSYDIYGILEKHWNRHKSDTVTYPKHK